MMLVGAVAAVSAAVSVGILLAQDAPPSAPTANTDGASDAPLTTLAGSTTLIPRWPTPPVNPWWNCGR